jgi:hypothetical protein
LVKLNIQLHSFELTSPQVEFFNKRIDPIRIWGLKLRVILIKSDFNETLVFHESHYFPDNLFIRIADARYDHVSRETLTFILFANRS